MQAIKMARMEKMLKIFPAKILFVTGDTLAVLLILLFGLFFFFLPFIDNKPEERKGKILTYIAIVFILYTLAMTVWSLL